MQNCTLLLSERLFDNLHTHWPKLKFKTIADPCSSPYELLLRQFNLNKDVSLMRLFKPIFPHINDKTLLAAPMTVHTEAGGAYIDPILPELHKDEIEALLSALNEFYSDIEWTKLSNSQLSATFEEVPQWKLPKVERAIGKNMQDYLQEHIEFAKFATELQMMLEALPMNKARRENNQPVVNFIWIWGAGNPVFEFKQHPFDLIVGHAMIDIALAQANESTYQSLIEFCDSDILSQPSSCLIDLNDYFVSYVEETYFEQIILTLQKALEDKSIQEVHIHTQSKTTHIKKKSWWPF